MAYFVLWFGLSIAKTYYRILELPNLFFNEIFFIVHNYGRSSSWLVFWDVDMVILLYTVQHDISVHCSHSRVHRYMR